MKRLIVFLALSVSSVGVAGQRSHGIEDIETVREKTDKVIAHMIDKAAEVLRDHDEGRLAKQLKHEYTLTWSGYLANNKAMYDHDPLFDWLNEAYDAIEDALPIPALEAARLDDIKKLNYAAPVTFSPGIAWDKQDYVDHFVPFSKILVYWGAMGACTYYSGGAAIGGCPMAAVTAEEMVGTFIAPQAGGSIYCSSIPEGKGCEERGFFRRFRRHRS